MVKDEPFGHLWDADKVLAIKAYQAVYLCGSSRSYHTSVLRLCIVFGIVHHPVGGPYRLESNAIKECLQVSQRFWRLGP